MRTAEGESQTACKPGSVPGRARETAIHLGRPSPDASRDQPGRQRGERPAAVARGPVVPIRSCSWWGLPCRSRRRDRGALLPHPFTLTGKGFHRTGGLLSVALSLGSPPPGSSEERLVGKEWVSTCRSRCGPYPTK